MKTIISEKKAACKSAAEKIAELLGSKENACLVFSFDLPDELFEELAALQKAGRADFSRVRVFSTGEFVSGKRLGDLLWKNSLSRLNINKENCYFINEDTYDRYDELFASFGGPDLIVLALGQNGQIAFNEPGTAFSSRTHIQKLSDLSKNQFAELFAGAENVPDKAMTLGIKSITEAKSIIVMAFGKEKADALHQMLYARTDPTAPAAFLQIPSDVSVYADPAAAEKI